MNYILDYKHRAELNKALVTLYVDGTISILQERWLRNKYVQCQVIISTSSTTTFLHHRRSSIISSREII